MALTICKECGKKISDTTSKCIHCGAPIILDPPVQAQNEPQNSAICENQDYSQAITDTTNSVAPLKEFASLTKDEKNALEDEFLENDKWARKYLQFKTEFKACRRTFYKFIGWTIVLAVALIVLGFAFKEKILLIEYFIVDPSLLDAGCISFLALAALCSAMFLYGFIGAIYYTFTHKVYIYSKKLQVWLEKEKGIKYMPPLVFEREKKIFESIIVE